MSRQEFIDWLAHAVELGLININEARELRRQFDAGELEILALVLLWSIVVALLALITRGEAFGQ